jgi:hypothetical protein
MACQNKLDPQWTDLEYTFVQTSTLPPRIHWKPTKQGVACTTINSLDQKSCWVVGSKLYQLANYLHRMVCVQSFMYQLLKGVAHCHSHGVMHRCSSLLVSIVNAWRWLHWLSDLVWHLNWCVMLIRVVFMSFHVALRVICQPLSMPPSDCKENQCRSMMNSVGHTKSNIWCRRHKRYCFCT